MDPIRWDTRPELRSPALLCAFKGWNDAGESASGALRFMAEAWQAERIAAIDPEEFYDFQVTRPQVRLSDGINREVTWPEPVISAARLDGPRDAVILEAAEPNMRWRAYCAAIVDTAHSLGVEQVITMGALLADVPHSQPVPITGMASDAETVARLGLQRSRYEGPTGIVGVLHDACARASIKGASLWAAVPHYVAAAPNPKAALALVRAVEDLVGAEVEAGELEDEAEEYGERVSEAVSNDPEVSAFVEELERRVAEEEEEEEEGGEHEEEDFRPGADLPSGDALAQEFQRFLRGRGEDPS